MEYEALVFISSGISALTCGVNLGVQNWLIQRPLLEVKVLVLCCYLKPLWITARSSTSGASGIAKNFKRERPLFSSVFFSPEQF